MVLIYPSLLYSFPPSSLVVLLTLFFSLIIIFISLIIDWHFLSSFPPSLHSSLAHHWLNRWVDPFGWFGVRFKSSERFSLFYFEDFSNKITAKWTRNLGWVVVCGERHCASQRQGPVLLDNLRNASPGEWSWSSMRARGAIGFPFICRSLFRFAFTNTFPP